MKIKLLLVFILSTFFISVGHSSQNSFYDLEIKLQTQSGADIGLSHYRGTYTVVSMFYTSCKYSCPLIMTQLKSLDAKIPKEKKSGVKFLLVSFDPENDTVESLKKTAATFAIDDSRWVLARSSTADVRILSILIGAKYKKLKDGQISHSNTVALVDPNGKIVVQTEDLNRLDESILPQLLN